MKKKLFIFLILGMLLIPGVIAASNIQVKYEIFDGSVLTTINSNSNDEGFEIKVPYDAEIIESNVNYTLNERILEISSGENIEIEYSTKAYIDKAGKERFFTLAFPVSNSDITLYLPENGLLGEERIILPEADSIETDGKRIYIVWNNFQDEQLVVSYGLIQNSEIHYWGIILVLILIVIGVHYYNLLKRREEAKKFERRIRKKKEIKEEDFTRNLYQEEKDIVKFLLRKKGNEAWTKEIAKELNINKVTLSRKLRSLEGKGLISRIPHGSENRIKLIKKTSVGF